MARAFIAHVFLPGTKVLHVIDEVLEPLLPRIKNNKSPDQGLLNPNAWELLDKSTEYSLALK